MNSLPIRQLYGNYVAASAGISGVMSGMFGTLLNWNSHDHRGMTLVSLPIYVSAMTVTHGTVGAVFGGAFAATAPVSLPLCYYITYADKEKVSEFWANVRA